MPEFNWICPHCQITQTVSDEKRHRSLQKVYIGDHEEGDCGLYFHAIGCSNPACKKMTTEVTLGTASRYDNRKNITAINKDLFHERIYPTQAGKIQPDYIPRQIVQDYNEACKISELSPKASATLVRRCLQGIIRDFCGISKSRLIDEIKELREAVNKGTAPQGVTSDSVEAIDHVRSIGNIGAHMEKDINVIVDVDPNEAQVLIGLIEMLFDEWYVARHTRQASLARLKEIAGEKDAAKKTLAKSEAAGNRDDKNEGKSADD